MEGTETVGNEILPLLCPEWRTASLVLDATDAKVVFANSQCIDMLRRRRPISLVGGRLAFETPDLDRRFHLELARLITTGNESAFLFGRQAASDTWLSVIIRNSQGFFRDAIRAGLGKAYLPRLVVVELFSLEVDLDQAAFASFAKTIMLSKAEAELAHAVATGISLQQAAEMRGVAISTVRQRMKVVLFKTGCRNQSEFIRLVLSLCPRRWN